MLKYSLRTSLMFSCLFASALGVFAQDSKPGASPAWTAGNPNAPVSIEVFNDYQCPPCATFNVQLKKLEAKYPDNVLIIFRNYPLSATHQNALLAAQAAEAAGLQGHFREMINQLYGKREHWAGSENARQLFMSYAQTLNLDLDRFARDLDGELVHERIRLDVERAVSLAVEGTPTVMLNGKMLSVGKTADIIALVDEALSNRKP
jgi:protein-disulfide isomerase